MVVGKVVGLGREGRQRLGLEAHHSQVVHKDWFVCMEPGRHMGSWLRVGREEDLLAYQVVERGLETQPLASLVLAESTKAGCERLTKGTGVVANAGLCSC
jgi:hypothetical protein